MLEEAIVVPYFCRHPECGRGWDNRRARSAHEKSHTQKVGRTAGPEPEAGTLSHYYWAKYHKVPWTTADRAAWATYIRNRRQHGSTSHSA